VTTRVSASLIVLIGALLGWSGGAGAQVTLASYDLFTAPTINPEKWIGLEFAGPTNTEVHRRILNTQAQLLLRTTGSNASDVGVTNASNRLRVGARALLTGTPRITAMEARMAVMGASVTPCSTNSGTTSRARAQVFGVFFNDGTGNNKAGDRTGDVSAGVQKVMDTSLGNRVEAFVQRCTDPACTVNASVVTGGTNFTRLWALGDTDLLRIVWNAGANNFVFTANRVAGASGLPNETVTLSYTVPDTALAKRWFNDFAQTSSMANCTGGAVAAFMDLRVDNVRLNLEAVTAATLP
jgi:hypothetical protein